jgi:5-methylcytosine-specific restriction endonuclease McrA
MTQFCSKRPRLRLDPKSYRKLWQQVMGRDGCRCQSCGRLTGLQVHHIHARSRLGDDAEENLITVCAQCHEAVHRERGSAQGRAEE